MTVRHNDPFKELKCPLRLGTCNMRLSSGGYLSPVTAKAGYRSGLTPKCLVRMIANGQQSTDPIRACWQKPTGLQAPSRRPPTPLKQWYGRTETSGERPPPQADQAMPSCMPSIVFGGWSCNQETIGKSGVAHGPEARVGPPTNSYILQGPPRGKQVKSSRPQARSTHGLIN